MLEFHPHRKIYVDIFSESRNFAGIAENPRQLPEVTGFYRTFKQICCSLFSQFSFSGSFPDRNSITKNCVNPSIPKDKIIWVVNLKTCTLWKSIFSSRSPSEMAFEISGLTWCFLPCGSIFSIWKWTFYLTSPSNARSAEMLWNDIVIHFLILCYIRLLAASLALLLGLRKN